MAFGPVLDSFIKHSPISTMVRALLERVLTPERLNECFARATNRQYTRELLFSSVFELMTLVVTKTFPSINAAYQLKKDDIGVSVTSVYNKLNGLEPQVCAQLLRELTGDLGAMVREMKGECAPLLPGYRVKMLDGNCLAATEHRLSVLRDKAAGALPGKSLVIYDPALEMAIDLAQCEDGHAQERALLPEIVLRFEKRDVVVADRNFCVRHFLDGLASRGAYFVCRHHQQMPYAPEDERKRVGETDTGSIFEQWIQVEQEDGRKTRWRRIEIDLNKKTRNDDSSLVILTNLPKKSATAIDVARLYQKRWSIETMFQQLKAQLSSEIDTLGYPKAALFGFCVALIAYNVMAVIKAAMRSLHGQEKIQNEVSGYYIAGEIGRTREGMRIAIPPEEWSVFQMLSREQFIAALINMAHYIKLDQYKKNPRGVKKTPPKRTSSPKTPHVSTDKLLKARKKSP